MNNLEKLVGLKEAEFELKIQISRVQELVMRLILLQKYLHNRKTKLISLDLEALDLSKEIEKIRQQTVWLNRALTQMITELIACDPQAMDLEEKIEEETAALDTGELTPQRAIALPTLKIIKI